MIRNVIYETIAGNYKHLRKMSTNIDYKFDTLKVTVPKTFVYHVEINRPEKRNAMNIAFWKEMVECFTKLNEDADCRSIVYSGSGKMFSSGIDLFEFGQLFSGLSDMDVGRKAFAIKKMIGSMQESFNIIEKCTKPVIAAVHGGCIGGAMDLITACDIRYCSTDAYFCVKEVEIGMAADVGTLQRLPKVVGNESLVRELCFAGRNLKADEAKEFGLISKILADRDSLIAASLETAEVIASRSPIAVQATKIALNYTRNHSVTDALEHMATMNSALLQSEDLIKAVTAALSKETPIFSKL